MSSSEKTYFTSLTHGSTKDCRQANAKLMETLKNYSFGSFLVEKSCFRCPNDDCNTSFLLILQQREFLRLKHQVIFDVRPTFLVHSSFRDIVEADKKIRSAILGENSIGIQVGPELRNVSVDASPVSSNSYSQTDFKVLRKDTGGQTDEIAKRDAECQKNPEKQLLSFTDVQRSDVQQVNSQKVDSQKIDSQQTDPQQTAVANKDVPTENSLIPNSKAHSPIRTLEVQQEEEEDVVFVEIRPRFGFTAPREIKEEDLVEDPSNRSVPIEDAIANLEMEPAIEVPVPVKEVKEEPVEEQESSQNPEAPKQSASIQQPVSVQKTVSAQLPVTVQTPVIVQEVGNAQENSYTKQPIPVQKSIPEKKNESAKKLGFVAQSVPAQQPIQAQRSGSIQQRAPGQQQLSIRKPESIPQSVNAKLAKIPLALQQLGNIQQNSSAKQGGSIQSSQQHSRVQNIRFVARSPHSVQAQQSGSTQQLPVRKPESMQSFVPPMRSISMQQLPNSQQRRFVQPPTPAQKRLSVPLHIPVNKNVLIQKGPSVQQLASAQRRFCLPRTSSPILRGSGPPPHRFIAEQRFKSVTPDNQTTPSSTSSDTPRGNLKRILNNSMTSNACSSSNTTTPSLTVADSSEKEIISDNSRKKQKFSDVEMCHLCWTVSYFTPIEEYCGHVLEMHSTLTRFKCNVCQRKFSGTLSSINHARMHIERDQGDVPMQASAIISPDISEDHLEKLMNTARLCYPDKFRDMSVKELKEIVEKMP